MSVENSVARGMLVESSVARRTSKESSVEATLGRSTKKDGNNVSVKNAHSKSTSLHFFYIYIRTFFYKDLNVIYSKF